MFEIALFDDGTYGIRNVMTGQFVSKKGRVLSYRTEKRARKHAQRIVDRLNRMVSKIEKQNRGSES